MVKMFGAYVGIGVDTKVKLWDDFKDMHDAGYTHCSIFLTTAFGNTGCWPWPLVGNKFDFSTISGLWLANLDRLCRAAKDTGITPHFCLCDQFHDVGDNPGPDPFRQAFGLNWDEEPLYSSWDGTEHTWLWWDPNKDPRYKATPAATLMQFKQVGGFGMAMQKYVKAVVGACKRTGIVPSVKWGNETLAEYDPATGKVTAKRGDRDEVVIWMRSLFRQAGIEPDLYFDYLCTTRGKHKTDPDYIHMPTMLDAFTDGVRGKHKAKLEVHGILTVGDCLKYVQAGLDPQYMLFSTDGDLNMNGDYVALGHSTRNVDLKFDVRRGQAWDTTDWQKNFDKYFGKYRMYVK